MIHKELNNTQRINVCQYALYEQNHFLSDTSGIAMETERKKIAARLKIARIQAGYESASKFAKDNKITGSTYISHENATRGTDLDDLGRYAKLLNVSIWWLAAGIHSEPTSDPNLVAVDTYDIRGSAGHGFWNDNEHKSGSLYFKKTWLQTVTKAPMDKLAVIYIDGDSMEPTLFPGDSVLIDQTRILPNDDGMYAVRFDGGLLIKRVTIDHHRKKIVLSSDNKAYMPIEPYDAGDVMVSGRVIWVGRRV